MADDVRLSVRDYGFLTLQTAIQAVPYIGAPFAEFCFGRLAEMRLQRIERTLTELGVAIQARGGDASAITTEEFATLFESIAPALAKTTTEEKRRRFRDLLINAASLKPGVTEWQDATLAAEILEGIESPGLSILGTLAGCQPEATLLSRPFPRIINEKVDGADESAEGTPLPYEWLVIEEWVRRLRERRLLTMTSHDSSHGGWAGIQLTALGRWFIDWILEERAPKGSGQGEPEAR